MSSSSPLSPHPTPMPLPFSSSTLTCCPELDLSITLSPTPKTGNKHLKLLIPKMSDQSQLKSCPQSQTERKRNTQVCFEEQVIVTAAPDLHVSLNRNFPPQQPIKGQRRSREYQHGAIRPWAEPAAASYSQDPGCLGSVVLNTTLALKAELQSLQGAEFHSKKAVQETLVKEERTKNLINTRATEVVNVSRSQLLFTSLVSVNVQKDQLVSQVLQDMLLLSGPPCCQSNKPTDNPSCVLFMSSDLFRQRALPLEEEPFNYTPSPSTHPPYSTFDLYKRRRRCEAIP